MSSTHKTNISAAIRYLASKNWEIKDIASYLNIRYQFAYNVVNR